MLNKTDLKNLKKLETWKPGNPQPSSTRGIDIFPWELTPDFDTFQELRKLKLFIKEGFQNLK